MSALLDPSRISSSDRVYVYLRVGTYTFENFINTFSHQLETANSADCCAQNRKSPIATVCADYSSGRKWDRTALRLLLSAIDRGEVDVLVVPSLSTLTRDLTTLPKVLQIIARRGIRLITAKENFDSGDHWDFSFMKLLQLCLDGREPFAPAAPATPNPVRAPFAGKCECTTEECIAAGDYRERSQVENSAKGVPTNE